MSRKNKTLVEWLGFDAEFDLNRAQLLGTFLGFIIALLGLALLSVWVIGLVQLVGAMVGLGPFSSDPTGAAIRNLGIVVAAMLGFPFLVWRSVVAQRNAITAEQSQITDRINKAVLGLGSEKISKRIYETPKYQKTGQNWNSDADGNPVPAVRPDGTPIVEREQFEESVPNIEVRLGAIYSLERIANDSDRDYANVMSLLAAYVRENANPRASNVKLREDVQAAVTLITKIGRAHV